MTAAVLEADIALRRGPLDLRARLTVHHGSTVAIVGPNGAGKSSLLRAIAGLEMIDAGNIAIVQGGTRQVLDAPADRVFVPPQQRRMPLVFQDHRLFPHLTAAANIEFAIASQPRPRRDRSSPKERTSAALRQVGLDPDRIGPQRADQLSGGQRQRVAIARALATEPRVLLLDEPFAAVDGLAHVELRRQIRSLDLPIVMVTHHAVDARLLADELIVLEDGAVTQTGSPQAVSDFPASAWTASLLGQNLVGGTANGTTVTTTNGVALTTADAMQGNVIVGFSPSGVTLSNAHPEGSARNVWRTEVQEVVADADRVRIRLTEPLACWVTVTPASVAKLGLAPGQPVTASVKATDLRVQSR